MTEDVRHFAQRFAVHRDRYANTDMQRLDFAPGEDHAHARAKPGRRNHRSAGRRGAWRRRILLLFVVGLGWAIYSDPSRVVQWGATAGSALMPLLVEVVDETLPPARPPGLGAQPTAPGNLAFASASSAPNVMAPDGRDEAAGTPTGAAATPQATSPETPKVIASLPPVKSVVQPGTSPETTDTSEDRYRSRARAVGLHPDLSQVLLAQLSAQDFRNAEYAIRAALSQTADDQTFKWPLKREEKLAMFEVRFVDGAADGCRRYVVAIEKNRWLTTALPMEKCGVKLKERGSAEKK